MNKFIINKGMVAAVDNLGNNMQVSIDDPRYLSGELVACSKGRTYYHKNKRKKIECPHCRKVGDSTNMKRWHFDNCKIICKS